MEQLRTLVFTIGLILGVMNIQSAYAGSTVSVDGVTLTANETLSTDQIIINEDATLSGNGTLTGSLLLEGTLSPGASEVGTFTIQSNFVCNGGTIELQVTATNITDEILISGTASGTAQVLLTASPLISPQDKAVIYGGAGSDYSGFTVAPSSPDWLIRQSANNLLIHELVYDTDGDGRSDYFETVSGTDLNDTNSLFQYTGYNFSTNPANIQIGFNTEAGRTYSLEYTTNLVVGAWVVYPASSPVAGDGADKQFTSPLNDDAQAFYRVGISRP